MKTALNKKINKNFILMLNVKNVIEYLENNVKNNDIILIKGSNSSITNVIAKELLKRKVD